MRATSNKAKDAARNRLKTDLDQYLSSGGTIDVIPVNWRSDYKFNFTITPDRICEHPDCNTVRPTKANRFCSLKCLRAYKLGKSDA